MSASMQRWETGLGAGDGATGLLSRPPAAADQATRRKQRVALASAIEGHVVPRLLVGRAAAPLAVTFNEATPVPSAQDVLDLVALAVGRDENAVRTHITQRCRRQSLEQVCFGLLAPAARHLGHMWDEDLCSFTDVTLGVMRLQAALHDIAARLPPTTSDRFRRHRILLTAGPQEQHTFGLNTVSLFFERAGWLVTRSNDGSLADLVAQVRRDWFGVMGFSIGTEAHLEFLYAAMPRIRAASRNTGLAIIVGGPIFSACPDLARQIGADATASDGVQATWLAENLLAAPQLVQTA
jgi:methanogenic corrinoid protein MtbC1